MVAMTKAALGRVLILAVMSATLLLWPSAIWAFKITEPKEDSRLKSGQGVTATVDLGSDSGIVKVSYYWYHEMDEVLNPAEEGELGARGQSVFGTSFVATPSLTAAADSTPPFGGNLKVPADAIGRMRLLAVASISRGRLGTRTVFDEILLEVEPEAELTAIEFETEKPLLLGAGQSVVYGDIDAIGKIFGLPVVGVFRDGVSRPIALPSTGTSYQSSNENVIKVLPGGLLQIAGNGTANLTVSNRGKQATLEVIVDVSDEPNEPPIADAGPHRTVKAGSKVKLSGLKSRDPEGETLLYTWTQVRGDKVSLLDLNMPEASFSAPQVSEKRLFRFKLRVTDKKGADSVPAFVDVVVEP